VNNDKCEFCKGTGKEPGEPGCVWCHNTGTKEGQALLTPPAQQHQGEPVACASIKMRMVNGRLCATVERFDSGQFTLGELTEVFTHAHPAEVERLRAEIEEWNRIFDMQEGKIDALRAQLAEAQALLQKVLGHLKAGKPGEAQVALYNGLPASAEPSAPKCETCSDQGIVGNILNAETCMDCTPSAPVEIDERAAFDAWFKDHSKDWPFPSESIKAIARDNDWLVWQARAALERKQ
jgi:hypothetical protein